MSQLSYKSDESRSEGNFMDDVSFVLEENLENSNVVPHENDYPVVETKSLPQKPILNEKPQTTKKPTKITINLKPKLLPQHNPSTNSNTQMQGPYSHDIDPRAMDDERMEDLMETGQKEERMVPDFLLGGKGTAGNNEASTSAIMKQVFPNRYFILKKLSKMLLEVCMETNYCVILVAYKKKLHDAYQNAENVYLIFSNTETKQFLGYSRMISEPENLEFMPDNLQERLSAECSSLTHCVIRVEKQANNIISFDFTKDLRNEFNNRSPVYYCKECQEVDKETAQKLCNLLDKPSLSMDIENTESSNNLPFPAQLTSQHSPPSPDMHPPHMPPRHRMMPGPFMMPPPMMPYMMPGEFGFPPMMGDWGPGNFGGMPPMNKPSLLNHLGLFSTMGQEIFPYGANGMGGLGNSAEKDGSVKKKDKRNRDSDESDKSRSKSRKRDTKGKKKDDRERNNKKKHEKRRRSKGRKESSRGRKDKDEKKTETETRKDKNEDKSKERHRRKTTESEHKEKNKSNSMEIEKTPEKSQGISPLKSQEQSPEKEIEENQNDTSPKDTSKQHSEKTPEKKKSPFEEEKSHDKIREKSRDSHHREKNDNKPKKGHRERSRKREKSRQNRSRSHSNRRSGKRAKSRDRREKSREKREKRDKSREKRDKSREKREKSRDKRNKSKEIKEKHREKPSKSFEKTKEDRSVEKSPAEKSLIKKSSFENPLSPQKRASFVEEKPSFMEESIDFSDFAHEKIEKVEKLVPSNSNEKKVLISRKNERGNRELMNNRVVMKKEDSDEYERMRSNEKGSLNDLREKITLKKQIKGSITNRIIKKKEGNGGTNGTN